MSESFSLKVFRYPDAERFLSKLNAEIEKHSGHFRENVQLSRDGRENGGWQRVSTWFGESGTAAVFLPYFSGLEYRIFHQVAKDLKFPWLEARVQIGSLWYYSLYDCNGEAIDKFSTCRQVWDQGETDEAEMHRWQGNADTLAKTLAIPVAPFERYLVNWGYVKLSSSTFEYAHKGNKAYETDKASYGEWRQIFDFLRSIGVEDPQFDGPNSRHHAIFIPQDRRRPPIRVYARAIQNKIASKVNLWLRMAKRTWYHLVGR